MSDDSYEPSADVTDFGVSISLDKIGLRIRSDPPLHVAVPNPLTGEIDAMQVNPEITVWSVDQARKLVFHLRRAIDAFANPN